MEFEWDPAKNEVNIKKHGIDFCGALKIWEGNVVTFQSKQWHHGEQRYLAIGLYQDREMAVVYVWRQQTIRLISARRAQKNEREIYWKSIGSNQP